MTDKVSIHLSLGELLTVKIALEKWQVTLSEYERTQLTESQQRDVHKFKTEVKSALNRLDEARSRYLRGQ